MEVKRFKVSDESKNVYGLTVLTAGCDFTQFKKNPVMLYDHDYNRLPIGTWEDLRVELNNDITAIPVFDKNDPFAVTVNDKVDSNVIKMASVGIIPLEINDKCITKWRLKEISITPFAGNFNAFRLYDKQGNLVNLNEQKQFFTNINTKEMGDTNTLKVTLVAGLNLNENIQDGELIRKVLKLHADNTALAAQVVDYNTKEKAATDALELHDKDTVVDAAVKAKKITAAQKPSYMKLEFADLKTILNGMAAPIDLGGLGKDDTVNKPDGVDKMTFLELSEKNPGYLAQIKLNDKEQYKSLFKAEYGVEPKNV